MPVEVTIHTCRSARERDTAHALERKLDLRHTGIGFWECHERVKSALPTLKRNNEHNRELDMLVTRDMHGRPSATVFDLGRPYITITLVEP